MVIPGEPSAARRGKGTHMHGFPSVRGNDDFAYFAGGLFGVNFCTRMPTSTSPV